MDDMNGAGDSMRRGARRKALEDLIAAMDRLDVERVPGGLPSAPPSGETPMPDAVEPDADDEPCPMCGKSPCECDDGPESMRGKLKAMMEE